MQEGAIRKIKAGKFSSRDLTRLNIKHDEGCDLLARRGPCNCDPEIELPPPIPVTGGKLNRGK